VAILPLLVSWDFSTIRLIDFFSDHILSLLISVPRPQWKEFAEGGRLVAHTWLLWICKCW